MGLMVEHICVGFGDPRCNGALVLRYHKKKTKGHINPSGVTTISTGNNKYHD